MFRIAKGGKMEDGSASSQSLSPTSPKGEGRWESHTIIKL